MKAKARFYKGIEYVVVSELPTDQRTMLDQKNSIERIKILMDDKIVGNCISYYTYTEWFLTTFKRINKTVKENPLAVRPEFNKI